MSRFTYTTITNLSSNPASAQSAINANFAAVQTLVEDFVSRSGAATNSMTSDLDMNSNGILNLAAPVNPTDAVRLEDISTYLTAVQTSEANAEASLDLFQQNYLGWSNNDPTVDLEGNTLIRGALYFNTSSNIMRVYNDATGLWEDIYNVFSTIDASHVIFTPSGNLTSADVQDAIHELDTKTVHLIGTEHITGLKTIESPILVTPALGTPASGVLTNCTGLPVSTGIAGLGSGVATMLATFSSANIAAACTDETGSGALVFGTTPTIATPVINGTVTGTGVSQSASALTLVQRDANQNSFANNFIANATNNPAGAGTTILTVASTRIQNFTGASTRTYQLPNATTVNVGTQFQFNNNGGGVVTITDNGSNTITTIPVGGLTHVLCTNNGSANGTWDYHFWGPTNANWGTASCFFQTIELNNASDTTLSRASAGRLAVEGSNVAMASDNLGFFSATTSAQLAGVISDETGTGALVFATSPTLVTPILGTPTSGTLTNCTGLPISSGVSGLGTGVATMLATFSSANIASACTDETGTGSLVFATSPTLVTPALGTPASGALTNCTSIPVANATGILGTSHGGTGLANGDVLIRDITFIIDGAGSVITTGTKGYLCIDFPCTINQVTSLADQSGSIVVNIYKCTYSQFDAGATHPVAADKITASAPPTITTATKAQDSTLTGWTTTISAGDILAYNVDSATTITRVTVTLKVTIT